MNTNLTAHVIVTSVFVTFVTILLLFSRDQTAQTVALGLIPLLIGWWIPSPVQFTLVKSEGK